MTIALKVYVVIALARSASSITRRPRPALTMRSIYLTSLWHWWKTACMKDPDLTILALADAKLLPPEVQDPFDRWRIWRTRDVVAAAVRKRLPKPSQGSFPSLQFYLERLE